MRDRLNRVGRALARKTVRRLVARQIAVNHELRNTIRTVGERVEALSTAMWDLPARADRSEASLAQITAHLEATDRARAEIIYALEAVRGRVDPLVEAARARPFMAGEPFQPYEEPGAGTVYGYHDAEDQGGGSYRAFEELFRGSEERVLERQRSYLGILGYRTPVIDAGCGRGEFLDLLRQEGISASGVDADEGMVERCRQKGLDVSLGDLNEHLASLDDESVGVIFSAQVIEHLPEAEFRRLLSLARLKLKPGGRFIAETVNPHAPDALKTFWVDLTHQHPVFPEVALAFARIAGFSSAFVFHPMGTGDAERDRLVESAYAVVATLPS